VNEKYASGRQQLFGTPRNMRVALIQGPGRHEKRVQEIIELCNTSNDGHRSPINVSQIERAMFSTEYLNVVKLMSFPNISILRRHSWKCLASPTLTKQLLAAWVEGFGSSAYQNNMEMMFLCLFPENYARTRDTEKRCDSLKLSIRGQSIEIPVIWRSPCLVHQRTRLWMKRKCKIMICSE
jgi:hypothetical protein